MNLINRTPPHDENAEIVLLGACLKDESTAALAAERLTPADFYRADNAAIFAGIRDLLAMGATPGFTSLIAHLEAAKTLREAGGEGRIVDVMDSAPSGATARFDIETIRNHAQNRRLIAWACETVKRAYTPGEDAAALTAEVIGGLVAAGGDPGEVVPLRDALSSLAETLDGNEEALPETIRFPWPMVDEALDGMALGELYVVGGDEGGGKSTLAYNLIPAAGFAGARTLVASYEVGPLRLAQCLTALGADVGAGYLYARRGQTEAPSAVLTRRGLDEAIAQWMSKASALPVDICPGYPDLTKLNSVLTSASVRRQPYKLIVIDHLHLMPQDRMERRGLALEEQIRKNINGLKELCQRHAVAAVVLAQFVDNRNRDDAPKVNDLKGSSALKQAATAILLLHIVPHDWEAMREGTAAAVTLSVGVEKNRYGRVGQRHALKWNLSTRRITE